MKNVILFIVAFFSGIQISFAQPIKPDGSFGVNGIIKTNTGTPYNYSFGNSGYKIFEGSDGAIFTVIEAGGETIISKRHADGSIDSAYGNKGFSTNAGIAGANAVMQPDGKIIVAGSVNTGFQSNFALARYNTNGSLDNSFSGDGKQTAAFGTDYSFATSLALQADGKIVVAGSANSDFAVARFNADGSPDQTFSGDGQLKTDFNSQTDLAFSVSIQKDGKIVVAGYVWNGTDNDFALARYNTDGSPDSTFSEDGKQTTSFGGEDYAYYSAIQDDGKIIVAGYAYVDAKYVLALARYNTDGSLDNSFSNDGKQTTDYGSAYTYFPTIALQKDGKILMSHYVLSGGNYDFALSRYNTDGSLDKTFSGDGKQTTGFNGANDYARAIFVQRDGKILLTGTAELKGSTPDFAICRYNNDGSLDKTFDKDGKVEDKLIQGYTVYKSTAVQKDGKVIAAGFTWNGNNFDFALSRYNTNGSPDSSFNGNGQQTTSFGPGDDFANSVAIQVDGKIVLAGSASNGKNNDFAFARYDTEGQPDKTFSGDGKETITVGTGEDYATAMVIQDDGKILAAGLSNNTSALIRLDVDGNPDNTFSNDGIQTTGFGSGYSQYNAIALQKDGKIVVAGMADYSDYTLARYTADGNLDKSFGDNGKRSGNFGYGYNSANAVTVQKDGKIVVAADVSQLESTTGFAVARFSQGGLPDSTFGQNGIIVPDDVLSYATSIAIEDNGKILVGGSWGNQSSITRIDTNGVVDAGFGDNGKQVTQVSGHYDIINSIAIVNDKLYAAGTAECPGNFGTIIKYQLEDQHSPLTVAIITPTNNARYIAAANIKITAIARDHGGRIKKVRFYNGAMPIRTKRKHPYSFLWRHVPVSNYTLTARATDNKGLVATSAEVHISVMPDEPPSVKIITPANGERYEAPAKIHLEAAAKDPDGRINKVRFYNGSTLLKTIRKYPYTYEWRHVPAGTYIITAVATDDHGVRTTSVPITITCISTLQENRYPSFINDKTNINGSVSVRLAPNPANNILNVYTSGWQSIPVTISIISSAGIVLKSIRSTNAGEVTQINISSLVSGMYTVKVTHNNKSLYTQFVKL